MRERRKLHQRSSGNIPGQKRVLDHLELERTHLIATNLTFSMIFDIGIFEV